MFSPFVSNPSSWTVLFLLCLLSHFEFMFKSIWSALTTLMNLTALDGVTNDLLVAKSNRPFKVFILLNLYCIRHSSPYPPLSFCPSLSICDAQAPGFSVCSGVSLMGFPSSVFLLQIIVLPRILFLTLFSSHLFPMWAQVFYLVSTWAVPQAECS